jgi:hypothetical protein
VLILCTCDKIVPYIRFFGCKSSSKSDTHYLYLVQRTCNLIVCFYFNMAFKILFYLISLESSPTLSCAILKFNNIAVCVFLGIHAAANCLKLFGKHISTCSRFYCGLGAQYAICFVLAPFYSGLPVKKAKYWYFFCL